LVHSEHTEQAPQSHYYIIRNGENTLYIGTYASAEPDVGELRLIARLSKSALPNGVPESDVAGGTAIEGSDVFDVGGETRSKFYSSVSLSRGSCMPED
jgi:rhamnogalacturonan endolyase